VDKFVKDNERFSGTFSEDYQAYNLQYEFCQLATENKISSIIMKIGTYGEKDDENYP